MQAVKIDKTLVRISSLKNEENSGWKGKSFSEKIAVTEFFKTSTSWIFTKTSKSL